MDNKQGYNGWKNYETWNVKLWLDNDQGTYNQVLELGEENEDVYDLAQAIKGFVDELMPDIEASMFLDLLSAALSEVDWHEIAEAVAEEVAEAAK